MTILPWLTFLPAALLVAAAPGANNFLAFANGMRSGLAPALAALGGRCAAFALLLALVIVGLGALLAASATAFNLIKWLGVAYLAWLGVRLWRSEALPARPGAAAVTPAASHLAWREFCTALANPKAVLLFTAFLPQFTAPGRPLTAQLVPLAVAYTLIELLAASAYAFAGSQVAALPLGRRGARRVNRLSGAMMLAAAGWLACARRAT